jgi:hypothetical protein
MLLCLGQMELQNDGVDAEKDDVTNSNLISLVPTRK